MDRADVMGQFEKVTEQREADRAYMTAQFDKANLDRHRLRVEVERNFGVTNARLDGMDARMDRWGDRPLRSA